MIIPGFEPIAYPPDVITIAYDHHVYVNGTKLVNGRPVISNHCTDSSRLQEFKDIGFSDFYIRDLMGTQELYDMGIEVH